MKKYYILLVLLFSLPGIQLFAGRGFFADCPAFITVGGVFYEVGNCSGTNAPSFHTTNLTNVSSLYLTYAEIQTFENSGDDVQNGDLYYRIWTGTEGGGFANIDLPITELLGGGDEKRSATPNVDLLFGLLPSTTYTLEIYYEAIGNFSPNLFHSNGGANFELTFTTAASLPVAYADFSVSKLDTSAKLLWATASETNNAHFEVQRSLDNGVWEKLGQVTGYGNSYERRDYQFIDSRPLVGMNHYRLKQVDFDGRFEYSKVVSVKFDREQALHIYPNPVNDALFLGRLENTDEQKTAFIFDVNGRLMFQQKINGEHKINVDALLPGIYFLTIKNETGTYHLHERFVKK